MDQQTSIDSRQTIPWLNKLIVLAQWEKKYKRLPFDLVVLFKEPTEYQAFLTRLRASVTDKTQLVDSSTETTPIAVARKKLLEAATAVPAIRELFSSDQDPFKDAPPNHLELLAEVSDVTADPQNMVYSRNGTLEKVIAPLLNTGELDPDALIEDCLNRFLVLEPPESKWENSIAEKLYELATSPHWYVVMASLRARRDYTSDDDQAAIDALKQWNAITVADETLKQLFAAHLSQAPKKLIRLAWEHREIFAEARAKLPENARESADDARKKVATGALLLFKERFPTDIEEIKSDLQVLATVGSHFVKVRKFAKLDGFVYTWPEIARLGMANYKALTHVEDLVLNRKPRPSDAELDKREARELYSLMANNERLIRFMRIRPWFSQIDEKDLMRIRPLAPVVVAPGRPGSSAGVTESVSFEVPQQPPSPAPQPPTRTPQIQTLTLGRKQASPESDQIFAYDVDLSMPPNLDNKETGLLTVGVEKLVERVLAAMGVSSDSGLQEVLKELFASDPAFAEERIRRGSVELIANLFGPGPLPGIFATPPPLRLVINLSERDLHYLPWEWWPTSMSTLLLSSPDTSVVRSFKSPTRTEPNPMIAPLRVMSVIPDAPTGARFTSEMTLKGFEELASAHAVHYRAVARGDATRVNLQRQLESFSPHIVHLEASWQTNYIKQGEDYDLTGVHVLLSKGDAVEIPGFGALLRANGVQLVVIGRNDLSRIYENAGATVAIQLAKEGLSVLAPMRAIDDTSATTFTIEFYRALLQGNELESALHLARRNLASKGGDWTVFALFADPDRLQYLDPIRAPA